MSSLSLDCPHCGTAKSYFKTLSVYQFRDYEYAAFFRCSSCGMPIVAMLNSVMSADRMLSESCNLKDADVYVGAVWPSQSKVKCPNHSPENVERYFDQAVDSLFRGNYDAAGMMFRKTLDVATRILAPESSSESLYRRIQVLRDAQRLTQELADWAHEIRIDGNASAHEEELTTKEKAEATKAFVELFLTYVFTLPGDLARRKAEFEEKPLS